MSTEDLLDAARAALTDLKAAGRFRITLTGTDDAEHEQYALAHELAKLLLQLAGATDTLHVGDKYTVERLPDLPSRPAAVIKQPFGDAVSAACQFLTGTGMQVLARDWCCERGGLAVVAQDHDTVVAVYLRTAINGRFGGPLTELGQPQIEEIRQLTAEWLSERHVSQEARTRVDVLGMIRECNGQYTIEHVREVTR